MPLRPLSTSQSTNPIKNRPWRETLVIMWSAVVLSAAFHSSTGYSDLFLIPFFGIPMLMGPLVFGEKTMDGPERGYLFKALAIANASLAIVWSYSITKFPNSDGRLAWISVAICWIAAVLAFFIGDRMTRTKSDLTSPGSRRVRRPPGDSASFSA